ncbi:MAG: EAL domain-containing protein [Gammaproteobacteria bacterium]|nr:EAL domain-containing protein [Gammaproteobacteria bacterium]
MKLNIKQKLRLAPAICLVLFIAVVVIHYFGEHRIHALTEASRALEQQRMSLQMLFRGINESLLTDGSPDSVAISEASIKTFDERYERLLKLAMNPVLLARLEQEVGPKWQVLRSKTPPFLKINDMNSDDDLLMVRYGRFLVDGNALMDEIQALADYSGVLAREGAKNINLLVLVVIVFSVLSMLWLFWHLYGVIAVPLNTLRASMLEVSDGEEELLERIDNHRQEPAKLDEQDLQHEITALHHSYQFMLASIHEHLTHSQETEAELQILNQELEQRVAMRTQALQNLNEQMREQILQREKTQEKLERSKRENLRILETVGEGIYGTDSKGIISFVNPAAARLLGYEPAEMIGKAAHPLFHHTLPSGERYPSEACPALATMQSGESQLIKGELFWRRDGSSFPVEYLANPVQEDGCILGTVVVFRDISEQKRSEERIHHLAHYDVLTDLPNRTLLKEQAEQAMLQTQRRTRGLAVLFLDLDHFKKVNDTLGHPFGDRLLKLVAQRIVNRLRPDDIVSRVGGDEFVVLLRDVLEIKDVSRVAEQLIEDIVKPVNLDEYQLSVGTSIGISLYPQDGHDVVTLQRHADTAMYQAKAEGRGTYCYFNESMNRATRERLELESALRKATTDGNFEMAYQPQVRLADGGVIGLEALLRWDHPERGSIGPDRFIPVAEESGLIVAIGEWVLRTACGQFRRWIDEGLAPSRFSVNLSGRQFRDAGLKHKIQDALKTNNLDPSQLELELTESCVMDDPESSIAILTELKAMGVKVAVDDFGIAYSSLSYLKRLPIDRLKIDRSFVCDIPQDTEDMAITGTIISMAHNLGLEVIAEGVETKEQLEFLQSKGCDEVQGFLFSRPLSRQDLGMFLKNASM